jgi:hypothetical protein
MQAMLASRFPALRPAHQRGLALWVVGALMAHSACQSAVVAALLVWGKADTIRQALREWLYDGADKAAPCHTQVEITTCFVPLLRWLLSCWHGRDLPLAIDATLHTNQVTALVVSVLYRGTAIPVAWHILRANRPGAWMTPICTLLHQLQPAVPASMRVVVLADRGLWSPRLWDGIRACGWHPLLRIQQSTHFTGATRDRAPGGQLVQPGEAWVERGRLGTPKTRRITVTMLAIWVDGQREPWTVVTDLAPRQAGVSWYALRMGIELEFRTLKAVGWRWEQTRRRDPTRIGRHWLIIAVATVWVITHGTRVEDAARAGVCPTRLRQPPARPAGTQPRTFSLFLLGIQRMRYLLGRGRIWTRLWLVPDPWPDPPADVRVTIID